MNEIDQLAQQSQIAGHDADLSSISQLRAEIADLTARVILLEAAVEDQETPEDRRAQLRLVEGS